MSKATAQGKALTTNMAMLRIDHVELLLRADTALKVMNLLTGARAGVRDFNREQRGNGRCWQGRPVRLEVEMVPIGQAFDAKPAGAVDYFEIGDERGGLAP